MPEDNFRPRVRPARGPVPTEEWPDEDGAQPVDPGSESTDPDDLLGPFDAVRRALDASRAAELAEVQAVTPGDPDDDLSDDAPTEPVHRTRPAVAAAPNAPPPQPAPANPAGPTGPPPAQPGPARPVPMPTKPRLGGRTRPVEAEPAAIARVNGMRNTSSTEYAELSEARAIGRRPPGPAGQRGGGTPRRGHGRLIAVIAGIMVLAFCGGAVVAITSGHGDSGASGTTAAATTPPAATAAPTPETTRAVTWVEDYIGPTHAIACDPVVCGLLGASGFPSSTLQVVTGVTNVEQADVIVLTGVLRTQLGNELGALVSPEPLAVFGTGTAEVEVAPIQLYGAAAYARNMAADRAGRRTAGTALLADTHLTVDASGRSLLAAGLVDSRVCALLALLAGTHTLTIAGFVPIGPGAGPDVPSAGVVIETVDGEPAAGASTAATGLLAVVKAQLDPYRPMSAAPGAPDGQPGLRIVYSQPGPLGLLPGSSPPPLG